MSTKIYPYMNGSKSAKSLAQALGIKILRREGPARRVDTIINWGSSLIERHIFTSKILNNPGCVRVAGNKLLTFEVFKHCDAPTVEWTTDKKKAIDWTIEGQQVVVRKKLTGHSGEGIEIVSVNDPMPDAPLYTKYTKKKDEYRIHVFQGEVIFQQRKARKKDVPDDRVNWQVRNLKGGFIFANDGVLAPDVVTDAAKLAVQALGLDFGAVDIGYKDGSTVCYEVNCAPGLEGSTLKAYTDIFQQFM